jgi:hypothetical protein
VAAESLCQKKSTGAFAAGDIENAACGCEMKQFAQTFGQF